MLLDGTWPVVNLLNGMHLRENEQHNKGSTSDDSRADMSACDEGSTHHRPPVLLVAHPEYKKGLELETTNSEHQNSIIYDYSCSHQEIYITPDQFNSSSHHCPNVR